MLFDLHICYLVARCDILFLQRAFNQKKGEKMYNLEEMFSKYDDIVTIDEIMEMLQIGRVTVYQMLQSGRIRRLRIGKRYIKSNRKMIEFQNFFKNLKFPRL